MTRTSTPTSLRDWPQPATYQGLLQSMELALEAAVLHHQSLARHPESANQALEIVADCARAAEAIAGIPYPTSIPNHENCAPVLSSTTLEWTLRSCIDLGSELLDNEFEPLSMMQVTSISQALGSLERALGKCQGIQA